MIASCLRHIPIFLKYDSHEDGMKVHTKSEEKRLLTFCSNISLTEVIHLNARATLSVNNTKSCHNSITSQ